MYLGLKGNGGVLAMTNPDNDASEWVALSYDNTLITSLSLLYLTHTFLMILCEQVDRLSVM